MIVKYHSLAEWIKGFSVKKPSLVLSTSDGLNMYSFSKRLINGDYEEDLTIHIETDVLIII